MDDNTQKYFVITDVDGNKHMAEILFSPDSNTLWKIFVHDEILDEFKAWQIEKNKLNLDMLSLRKYCKDNNIRYENLTDEEIEQFIIEEV